MKSALSLGIKLLRSHTQSTLGPRLYLIFVSELTIDGTEDKGQAYRYKEKREK